MTSHTPTNLAPQDQVTAATLRIPKSVVIPMYEGMTHSIGEDLPVELAVPSLAPPVITPMELQEDITCTRSPAPPGDEGTKPGWSVPSTHLRLDHAYNSTTICMAPILELSMCIYRLVQVHKKCGVKMATKATNGC